jgi:hypothetical protein
VGLRCEKNYNRNKKHDGKLLLMTYPAPVYIPYEHFISVAKENGIPLVRNDESFKFVLESPDTHEYFFKDNWHPNKQGYSIIANNAFERIRDNNLLGLKNAP